MTGVPLLDPELFPAFIATAELGDLRSAAASTRMTSSGLSEHLAKLEAQLGCSLFVRVGDSLRVTTAGQSLLEYARRELRRVDEMFERLDPDDEQIAGLVSWVTPPSCVASRLLPDLLQRLRTYPQLRYSIRSGDRKRCIELVCAGEVDFALVHECATDAPIVFTPLGYEECVVVSAARHALVPPVAGGDSITGQPLVFYPGCEDYLALWWSRTRKSFAGRPLRSVHVSLEIDSVQSAIASVIAGAGVSVFPRHCVADALAQGQLTAHPAASPLRHRLYVARRTALAPPARVQRVLDWLKQSVAACKPVLCRGFDERTAGDPS
jgi:DNA-binding transcriptional LysR family regulator